MKQRLLIAIGIAALAAAATMLYEAHELTSSSYNYINARTCVEALKELEPNPFNESAAASITARLPISIQVVVEGVNGTQLARYGNYIPITPQAPGGVLPPSGGVAILGPGACMYVGSEYTVTVKLGLWPKALYAGAAGFALLIGGFASLIVADRAGEGRQEGDE
ncbi:hypothetical protein GCM10007981_10900 [Thermocladium modestius]|uniref:Uncharacterized protein n=1 Tax=Thermocladium modestius TaxID=62609 RepID=A0A830GUH6_9CREN|nr:hypothetical protein [Thermocladium modestius]GGP20912.1 hypothetical protein GCM10007981_10900 [Thermocladium modestius]